MINKVLTEEEMFEERLRRLDKQEYLDEKEHNFILANIKACFRETIHQRDYIKQLESKIKEYKNLMGTPIQDIMKRLKILEIIKKWSFLDTFYREDTDTTYDRFLCNIHTKGMKEDFEKVKDWLNE